MTPRNFRSIRLAGYKGLVASALALTVLSVGCGRPNASLEQKGDFAGRERINSELFLRADGQKELRREVDYWEGTNLLKRVTVFYSSGGKQISVYREDGTISVLTEWYPEPGLTVAQAPPAPANTTINTGPAEPATIGGDTAGKAPAMVGAQKPEAALGTAGTARVYDPPVKFGKIKRSIEYGADGKTVVKSSFFREDGSMAAYGRLLADGTFEMLEYTADGKTMARHQMFTDDGYVTYMRVVAGEPANSLTRTLAGRVEETVNFRDNGVRFSRVLKAPGTGFEEIEFYKEDGKTLIAVFYRQYKIEALYYKPDGNVDHYRSFDYDGGMTVTKYRDGAGKKKPQAVNGTYPQEAYRQYWKSVKDASGNTSLVLDRVEEIGADGRVARKLHFSGAGGRLTRVDYLDEAGLSRQVVILREDGTVERVDDYARPAGGGAATITSTEVAPEKGMRESFDERALQEIPFEDLREKAGPALTYPYYYGYDDYYGFGHP